MPKTIQSKRHGGNVVRGLGHFPKGEPRTLKNEEADALLKQFPQDFEEVSKATPHKEIKPPVIPTAEKKESEGSK